MKAIRQRSDEYDAAEWEMSGRWEETRENVKKSVQKVVIKRMKLSV